MTGQNEMLLFWRKMCRLRPKSNEDVAHAEPGSLSAQKNQSLARSKGFPSQGPFTAQTYNDRTTLIFHLEWLILVALALLVQVCFNKLSRYPVGKSLIQLYRSAQKVPCFWEG